MHIEELEVVWNGTMGRNYQPFVEPVPFVCEPIEPLPPKPPKAPHDCHWRDERDRVLAFMADGHARRIAAIGIACHIDQRVLHGFMQRWKQKGIFVSVKDEYGCVRLNRGISA